MTLFKWARYMRCDGSPDPTIAGEINTYLNLQREDNSCNGIESVLPSVKHTRDVRTTGLLVLLYVRVVSLSDCKCVPAADRGAGVCVRGHAHW